MVDSDPYGHNLKDKHSEAISMRSGVPQGPVVGPFLLLLFVIYLPDGLEAPKLLFKRQSCWCQNGNSTDTEFEPSQFSYYRMVLVEEMGHTDQSC